MISIRQSIFIDACTRNGIEGVNAITVLVRKIRASDKADILEISSKVWEGHDYLPYVLDKWLADPKCYTYGVQADERIVAVGNLRLVDARRTGWMEGLRVHPDYRRKGYADMLTQHFVELGSTLKVRQLRYSTGDDNRASLRLAKKAGFVRLLKMDAFWFENPILKPAYILKRVTEATPPEIHELSKTNPSLIPRGIVVYEWKAVNATLQGFKEVGKDHTFSVSKRRGEITAFSIGHKRTDSENGSWSFTVYASEEDNFKAHFCYQIRTALDLGLTLAVCTSQTRFENTLKDDHGLPKYGWKMQLILLEKQIKQ
jgi:ribosomal protein S18 acetylase RimI-like enzyme